MGKVFIIICYAKTVICKCAAIGIPTLEPRAPSLQPL